MTQTAHTPDTSDCFEVSLIENSDKRQHFTDVRHVAVRWEPYKPDGRRQMKAKGRWQEQVGSGDYWRWQNCDRPAFAHDVEVISAELLEALDGLANTVQRHGDWDDGCFYYNNRAAPELQECLRSVEAAIAKARAAQ